MKLQNWATRFDPKVRFSFNPDDNNGDISWVGATKYLFHGPNLVNLPKKGFGAIAMQEVMELYRQWMDPRYNGWVELRDQSEKYVKGAFWDEEKGYSFKLLRAFESWNNENLSPDKQKHVSYYTMFGFKPTTDG